MTPRVLELLDELTALAGDAWARANELRAELTTEIDALYVKARAGVGGDRDLDPDGDDGRGL